MTDDLITLTEAARLLGLTRSDAVRKLVSRGRLQAVPAGAATPKGRGYFPSRTRLVRRGDVLRLREATRTRLAERLARVEET